MASFLDTNIFVYADDVKDPRKKARAIELIGSLQARREAVISIQVLQEYFSVALRKLGSTPAELKERVMAMGHMRVVLFETADVARAIEIHSSEQVSPWDALVIQAALKGGCETLYTEDLQDGRKFGALTVVNPFHWD